MAFVTIEDVQFPLPDTVEQAWDEILFLRRDALKMRRLAAELATTREKERRQHKANTQALGKRIQELQAELAMMTVSRDALQNDLKHMSEALDKYMPSGEPK